MLQKIQILIKINTNLIFIKHIEDEGSKLCRISKRKKLFVYLLKSHSVQLPTWTILDETFVPEKNEKRLTC